GGGGRGPGGGARAGGGGGARGGWAGPGGATDGPPRAGGGRRARHPPLDRGTGRPRARSGGCRPSGDARCAGHVVLAVLREEVQEQDVQQRGRRRGDEDFFFQAEDGIRDFHVTGVQTCALPI